MGKDQQLHAFPIALASGIWRRKAAKGRIFSRSGMKIFKHDQLRASVAPIDYPERDESLDYRFQ
jgi:hypothetical protein